MLVLRTNRKKKRNSFKIDHFQQNFCSRRHFLLSRHIGFPLGVYSIGGVSVDFSLRNNTFADILIFGGFFYFWGLFELKNYDALVGRV
jgi:hypothetical protein